MNHFNKILERTKPENIKNYLLSGSDNEMKLQENKNYEERTELAFENFLNSLENMFPAANREHDELLSSIITFFTEISDIYMEVGLLTGIQLYKNFEKASWKFEHNDSIQSSKSVKKRS